MFYRFWLTLSFKIQALQGSDDKDSVKIHWLERFFDGRYVRLYPQSWYGDHICMRVEIYGCIPGNVMLNICSLCKLKGSKIKKANVTSIPSLLPSKSRNFYEGYWKKKSICAVYMIQIRQFTQKIHYIYHVPATTNLLTRFGEISPTL